MLYRYRPSDALFLIKNAITILDQWKSKYIKYKKDIEILSIDYFRRWAWEFDERKLFQRLDYVRNIVKDLLEIMEVKFS